MKQESESENWNPESEPMNHMLENESNDFLKIYIKFYGDAIQCGKSDHQNRMIQTGS